MLNDNLVNSEFSDSADEAPTEVKPVEPVSIANDDLPRPPVGRRSKTRPAGPPQPAPAPQPMQVIAEPPEPEQVAPADVSPATEPAALLPADVHAAIGASTEDLPEPLPAEAIEASDDDSTTKPATEETADSAASSGSRDDSKPARADDEDDEQPQGEIPDLTAVEPAQDKHRSSRRRSSRKSAQPADEAGGGIADEIGAALVAAESAAAKRRRPKTADDELDKEQVLASLAAAIAGSPEAEAHAAENDEARSVTSTTSATGEDHHKEQLARSETDTTGEDESTSEDDSSEDETSEHSGSSQRRRRRRGGRRRRKSSGGDDADERSDDDAEVGDADAESDEPDTEKADDSKTAEPEEPGEASGSSNRRRRRRRRRVDDSSEDGDLAVHVREPRHASDEVSGIEGSTRLEAKKQRRREGRAAGRHRAPILTEAEFLARRESVERIMMVRQREDYTQIAVLEDNVLVEHYVDRSSSTSLIGNIYLGRVQNVLPSMEAVFIDIGRGRNAVLYAGEVDWAAFDVSSDHRKVEQVFKSGQPVLVQVSKDPIGAKGARLTGHISIPGRYVVYSPGGHLSGISRKLPDSERHRLKKILDSVVSEESSVIVRTAAEGASEAELTADVERLKAQWDVIQKKMKQNTAPHQLYAEPDLTLRIIRDTFTEDFKHLFVAGNGGDNDIYQPIKDYLEHVAPHLAPRLSQWDSSQGDPFAKFRIDEQISKALERKVFLPSGGSLVIDRTEAMTVIDVNTGKFTGSGGNLEETVTRNNLEAAEEIVRQLRLRDLGGIIVVDFIDMVLPSNRELLLRRLVECLGRDRTRHQVSEVTSLGLVQMTRKRIGTGLAEAFTDVCEHCGGRGYIRHDEPIDSQAPADGGERRGGKPSASNNRNNRRSKAKPKTEEASAAPKANQVQPSEEAKQAAARLAAAASRQHAEQPASHEPEAGADTGTTDSTPDAAGIGDSEAAESSSKSPRGEILAGEKPAGELEAGAHPAADSEDNNHQQTV